MLIIPIILHLQWTYITPLLVPDAPPSPFAPLLFVSHPTPAPDGSDQPYYRKGYLDLVFIAYYIVFFSFLRQIFTLYVCRPFAYWWGIRTSGKLDRFGEQGYAIFYWGLAGLWGVRIMAQLPTWWYRTEYFWIGAFSWIMDHDGGSADISHSSIRSKTIPIGRCSPSLNATISCRLPIGVNSSSSLCSGLRNRGRITTS